MSRPRKLYYYPAPSSSLPTSSSSSSSSSRAIAVRPAAANADPDVDVDVDPRSSSLPTASTRAPPVRQAKSRSPPESSHTQARPPSPRRRSRHPSTSSGSDPDPRTTDSSLSPTSSTWTKQTSASSSSSSSPRRHSSVSKHRRPSSPIDPAPGQVVVTKPDPRRDPVLVARPRSPRQPAPRREERYHTQVRRPSTAKARDETRLEIRRHKQPVESRCAARPWNPRRPHRQSTAAVMAEYNNAVLTLVPHATGDPFVAHALGKFFLTFTLGDRIEIWRADSLEGFMTTGDKITVFRAPPDTDHSQGLWAPELHDIGGRWYILYTAEDPKIGIDSHRMFVLGGPPSTEDPCIPHDANDSPWQDLGHVGGMRADQWAIDGTYFWADGGLYMAYSGSPLGVHPAAAKTQELFVVHMASPVSADSAPSLVSAPTEPHEFSGDRGVNEGPQWLAAPDGAWRGLVISVAGTWTQDYKMLPLQLRAGGNPLDPRAWHKWRRPLCEKGKGMRGPFGPGHGNFIDVAGETVAVFHATDGPRDGFENRKARAQRVAWTPDGPSMGGRVGPVVDDIAAFNAGPSKAPRAGASKRSSRQRWDDLKQGYKYWTSGW